MDKRRKRSDAELERRIRAEFYSAVAAGRMSVGQAVAAMRRISKLTQPEFAKHRGLSVQSLRLIETDKANPTIETLNKIANIFGLQVGFVPKASQQISWRDLVQNLPEDAGSTSAPIAPPPSANGPRFDTAVSKATPFSGRQGQVDKPSSFGWQNPDDEGAQQVQERLIREHEDWDARGKQFD